MHIVPRGPVLLLPPLTSGAGKCWQVLANQLHRRTEPSGGVRPFRGLTGTRGRFRDEVRRCAGLSSWSRGARLDGRYIHMAQSVRLPLRRFPLGRRVAGRGRKCRGGMRLLSRPASCVPLVVRWEPASSIQVAPELYGRNHRGSSGMCLDCPQRRSCPRLCGRSLHRSSIRRQNCVAGITEAVEACVLIADSAARAPGSAVRPCVEVSSFVGSVLQPCRACSVSPSHGPTASPVK